MNANEWQALLDRAAERYLDALDREDFDAMASVWELAGTNPELERLLDALHVGLLDDQSHASTAALEAAVERHLPSASIIRATAGPITVAEVADELFRHAPDRLPAAAHALNERLRHSREPLPADLGLFPLADWAEATFGTAPAEYWKAFRQAALKVRMRANSEADFRLAARRGKPAPEGGK